MLLVASAVPVAVLANVMHITVTGLLYNAAQDDLAHTVFHDVAGLLMMPLAVGILLWELRVLNRLVINHPERALHPDLLLGPTPAQAKIGTAV